MEKIITNSMIENYRAYLWREEKARGTIEKYMKEIESFTKWLGQREVTKELVIQWKTLLLEAGYVPRTVNAMLSAVNGFFSFLEWEECRVKFLKIQRQMFRDESKDLGVGEYRRLVDTAYRTGKERLGLVIETICGTGIRVSELKYITLEAVKNRKAEIVLKGKIRVIMLPEQLRRKLLRYAKKRKIRSGSLFLTAFLITNRDFTFLLL